MKIKTWIKYEESYLPPKCRKLRYRECEEYVNIELKEVNGNELQLAFEDSSYEGKGKIYFYKGKLYSKVEIRINDSWFKEIEEKEGVSLNTALARLMYCNEHCSSYFRFAFDREHHAKDTSRNAVIKKASDDMEKHILVDGELYKECSEPRYVVVTFGLGNNCGGTGLFCQYFDNENIAPQSYFTALQGEEAVAYANKVAFSRGDTKDVGKFKPFIKCYMPELVKLKPNKTT